MKAYVEAAQLLPPEYRDEFLKYGGESAEEIRLRSGRKAGVVRCGAETELNTPAVGDAALLYVIEKATGASVHSAAETLKNGFISRHGLRIGVCGQAVMKDGEFAGYRSYSSVNIRIRHTYYFVVAKLAFVELFKYSRPESRYHSFNFRISINFIKSRLFYI